MSNLIPMGRKKNETTIKRESGVEREKKALLKQAMSRLPSQRSKIKCAGCFAPRDTLTVKSHVTRTWKITEIEIYDTKSGVRLPCKHCGEIRYLNLSKFSLDVHNVDRDTFTVFILLKDDKYNALIGYTKESKTLDLTGFQE